MIGAIRTSNSIEQMNKNGARRRSSPHCSPYRKELTIDGLEDLRDCAMKGISDEYRLREDNDDDTLDCVGKMNSMVLRNGDPNGASSSSLYPGIARRKKTPFSMSHVGNNGNDKNTKRRSWIFWHRRKRRRREKTSHRHQRIIANFLFILLVVFFIFYLFLDNYVGADPDEFNPETVPNLNEDNSQKHRKSVLSHIRRRGWSRVKDSNQQKKKRPNKLVDIIYKRTKNYFPFKNEKGSNEKNIENNFHTRFSQVISTSSNNGDGALKNFPPACKQKSTTFVDDIDITLVTQLTYDRLWMMEHHCARWTHSISIVVYNKPSFGTDSNKNLSAKNIKKMLTQTYKCPPDILSSVQLYNPPLQKNSDDEEQDYPINKLRNMAISAVQTSYLLYIDVDFWPSTDLYYSIQKQLHTLHYSDKIDSNNTINPNTSQVAVVIPAFQINRACQESEGCRDINIKKMPKNSLDLLHLLQRRELMSFDPTNNLGHGSTIYDTWFRGQLQQYRKDHSIDYKESDDQDDIMALPCIHSDRYEPYVVIKYCDTLPPFQQQFEGYGKNKMTWIMHLRHLGYQFLQYNNDGGFLVHYPHLDSPIRQSWAEGPEKIVNDHMKPNLLREANEEVNWMEYKRGQVDALYVKFRHWLQQQPTMNDSSKKYLTPMCKDAWQNQEEQDKKLWVTSELLNKYRMKPF